MSVSSKLIKIDTVRLNSTANDKFPWVVTKNNEFVYTKSIGSEVHVRFENPALDNSTVISYDTESTKPLVYAVFESSIYSNILKVYSKGYSGDSQSRDKCYQAIIDLKTLSLDTLASESYPSCTAPIYPDLLNKHNSEFSEYNMKYNGHSIGSPYDNEAAIGIRYVIDRFIYKNKAYNELGEWNKNPYYITFDLAANSFLFGDINTDDVSLIVYKKNSDPGAPYYIRFDDISSQNIITDKLLDTEADGNEEYRAAKGFPFTQLKTNAYGNEFLLVYVNGKYDQFPSLFSYHYLVRFNSDGEITSPKINLYPVIGPAVFFYQYHISGVVDGYIVGSNVQGVTLTKLDKDFNFIDKYTVDSIWTEAGFMEYTMRVTNNGYIKLLETSRFSDKESQVTSFKPNSTTTPENPKDPADKNQIGANYVYQFIKLSNEAYKDAPSNFGNWEVFDLPKTSELQEGFFAVTYSLAKTPADDLLVIAVRGSDAGVDYENDCDLKSGNIPSQYNYLKTYVERVVSENPEKSLYALTGHSLGAALAQLYVADSGQEDLKAVVFESPSPKKVIDNNPGQFIKASAALPSPLSTLENIEVYNANYDPINSIIAKQIAGSIYQIDTQNFFELHTIKTNSQYALQENSYVTCYYNALTSVLPIFPDAGIGDNAAVVWNYLYTIHSLDRMIESFSSDPDVSIPVAMSVSNNQIWPGSTQEMAQYTHSYDRLPMFIETQYFGVSPVARFSKYLADKINISKDYPAVANSLKLLSHWTTSERVVFINIKYGGIDKSPISLESSKYAKTYVDPTTDPVGEINDISGEYYGTNYKDTFFGTAGDNTFFPCSGNDVINDIAGFDRYSFLTHNMYGHKTINDIDGDGEIFIFNHDCTINNPFYKIDNSDMYVYLPQFNTNCDLYKYSSWLGIRHTNDVFFATLNGNSLTISLNKAPDISNQKFTIADYYPGKLGIWLDSINGPSLKLANTNEQLVCSKTKDSIFVMTNSENLVCYDTDKKCSVISTTQEGRNIYKFGGCEIYLDVQASKAEFELNNQVVRKATQISVTNSIFGLRENDLIDISAIVHGNSTFNFIQDINNVTSIVLPSNISIALPISQSFVYTDDGFSYKGYNATSGESSTVNFIPPIITGTQTSAATRTMDCMVCDLVGYITDFIDIF